ncbi:MAG: hypothetical protein ACOC4G_01870 [Bacillota bacterium]
MNKKELAEEINKGKWNKVLSEKAISIIEDMNEEGIIKMLEEITNVPIIYSSEISGEIYRLYFISCWLQIFEKLFNNKKELKTLEIASGQSDPVPQALELYTGGRGSYTTANLNKDLTRGLKNKTANLNIEIEVIEDNAMNLHKYYQNSIFDITAFQHAINDMIQTIAAQKSGIDTVNNDWFDILPDMVKIVTGYYKNNTLKDNIYNEFMEQIKVCTKLLKKGGCLVFNTHVFQMDLDAGYPLDLYSNFVKIARKWINESSLNLKEVELKGFEKKWWLILEKNK